MEWCNINFNKWGVKGDDVMNPIDLGKAIAEVGTPIITAVMLILVVGLVWYLIKRQTKREDKHYEERTKRQEKHDKEQKDERDYYRNIISGELRKNVDLNVKGITLQTEMMKEIKEHDGQSREAWTKLNGSLGAICERLNGSLKDNKKNGQKK